MPDFFTMFATAVTSTSAVSLVTNGATEIAVVRSVTIYNAHTANTASVSVLVSTPGTAAQYVVSRFTQLTCQESTQALSQPVVLNASDSLAVKCEPAGEVHAVASFLRMQ